MISMQPLTLRYANVLGFRLIDEPADRIASVVCDRMSDGHPRSFVFLNPHSVVCASNNVTLKASLSSGTELLCDGVGMSLAALVLNRRLIHRVWGQDFFHAVSTELSNRHRGRVFFLGGHLDSIEILVNRYRQNYPGLKDISWYVPAFTSEFSTTLVAEMAERIKAFRPDVLWIGVGSPKQELLLQQLQQFCGVPCAAAIGAVFDFYSGRISLGPKWIRDFGLLWAYRLILEPRRLWRRTFVSAPLFILRVFQELARPDSTNL
jgi:N-acetylglucosaminyldiphosphoundecaprenol N-acetyl-beta-D-mannosaminyltransferase